VADLLALPALYDAVQAVFTADGPADTSFAFGWREPPKQTNQGAARVRRVVFVPGDDKSGSLGADKPAVRPGRNPRPIATLGELFTVYLWARDAANDRDERLQYQAVRKLYDAWRRSLHLAGYAIGAGAQISVQSASYLVARTESPFGAEIRVLCSIDASVPDQAWSEVTDASPSVSTELQPNGLAPS